METLIEFFLLKAIGGNGDGLKLVAPLLIKDMKLMLTDKPSEQIF